MKVSDIKKMLESEKAALVEHSANKRVIQDWGTKISTNQENFERQVRLQAIALLREQQDFSERIRKYANEITALDQQIINNISNKNTDLFKYHDQIKLYKSSYIDSMASIKNHFINFKTANTIDASIYINKIGVKDWDILNINRDKFLDRISLSRHTYIDSLNKIDSIIGIAKLYSISQAVSRDSFVDGRADFLRQNLGDWRDHVSVPDAAATNVVVRTKVYIDQGYDITITDFPDETLNEWTRELRADGSAFGVSWGENSVEQQAEPYSFDRNNNMHEWLQRFEAKMRHFIDARMSEAFGPGWPRNQLPNGMYDRWIEKKSKDQAEVEWPLIYYADFTDYAGIICRGDNWKAGFARHFVRPETVRESLQRLHLPRLATMHARPLSADDALFACVEIKRLIRVFGSL